MAARPFPPKPNMLSPRESASAFPGTYPKERKTRAHTETARRVYSRFGRNCQNPNATKLSPVGDERTHRAASAQRNVIRR